MQIHGKVIYDTARAFLSAILEQQGVSEPAEFLKRYAQPEKSKDITQPSAGAGFDAIMVPLLNSWKNAQGKFNMVSDMRVLDVALFGFDHKKIIRFFEDECAQDNEALLDHIIDHADITVRRREPQSHWPQFCKGLMSICYFLATFDEPKDFIRWLRVFYDQPETRHALPLVLGAEIHGYAYALACDFLKEVGFAGYGKPDVHIRDILAGCGRCGPNASDYTVAGILVEMAGEAGVAPYEFDKLLWLIGSGKFYALEGENPKREIKVGDQKKAFLELLLKS